jgi:hypothetical protein
MPCRAAALESFAAGISCAEWHLGRFHPLLCELDATVADALIAVGDYSNALQHLSRARDLAVTALGHNHRMVASLTLTIAELFRTLHPRVAGGCLSKAQLEYERAVALYETLAKGKSPYSPLVPALALSTCHGVVVSGPLLL